MPHFTVLLVFASLLALSTPARAQQAPANPSAPAATAPAMAVYERPPAPGTLVDIGGRRLHVRCTGPQRGPTVVFEAGLSQFTANGTYSKAQDLIAEFAHVCVYDRAGLGWSDAAPSPRTHDEMADDLHRLAAAQRWPMPLVLVGHSIGGLLARRYVARYPAEVAGVVLADATTEDVLFTSAAADERKALVARIDAGLRAAKPGQPVVAMPAGTAPEVMLAFTPEVLAAVKQEYEAIDATPAALRGANGYGTLGAVPLIVIRRGRTATPPSAEDERWRQRQEGLTALSSRASLVVATNAGHAIPYDDPALVAAQVRAMLETIRGR
jgi:pimeloyl-ACP methyl ester carboxylesterase